MKINHAIIHELRTESVFKVRKEQAQQKELVFSENEHPSDDSGQLLILLELLEERIKTAGRGSSKFKDPKKKTSTTGYFNKYIEDKDTFLDFAKNVSKIIEARIPDTATGGYLTFIDYTIEGVNLLFVCVLKLEDGVTIDAGTMRVTDATSIQARNIHEGARINLDQFRKHLKDESANKNYIDWIKTKQSQKLSAYFQYVFDIDIEIDNKRQTTLFKKAVDHYVEALFEDSEVETEEQAVDDSLREDIKHELKTAIYNMVNQCAVQSSSIDFKNVENLISGTLGNYDINPNETFIEFTSNRHAELTNLFKPFNGTTKNWGIVKGEVKNEYDHRIKFYVDRSMSKNRNYFEFDESKREITIKRVSLQFFRKIM